MPESPNVLLVTTDHWFGRLLGSAGHPTIRTPTLDALAADGIRFRRAYSECPVCIPARRSLMTGTSPRTHGDRVYDAALTMPAFPTLAQTFADNGYQAYAVGKLHVHPQRDRIGFDDVLLAEEGRQHAAGPDDYEQFLAEQGYAGHAYTHGMSNNQYHWRPWHLPERCHITNWCTQQMARTIKRRDPTRPALWYLSYIHPHPPLTPLRDYLDLYGPDTIDMPVIADWARDHDHAPQVLRDRAEPYTYTQFDDRDVRLARRAFYALCTHIDHQLRIIIGTLREEGILDNTIILVTSDHGDMLGEGGLWCKRLFYENAANIPMLLLGAAGDERVEPGRVDDRLVALSDVMPTLLDLAGIAIPNTVEGMSMVGSRRRTMLYGECGENRYATRMMHDGRFKLIYYGTGNTTQLFDLDVDPEETRDLADDVEFADVVDRLRARLVEHLHGTDEEWFFDGKLVGQSADVTPPATRAGRRHLGGQRGLH